MTESTLGRASGRVLVVEALKAGGLCAVLIALSLRAAASDTLLSILNLAALALFVFVAWQWTIVGHRRGSILLAAGLAVAGTVGVFLFFDPALIPIDWITILHEGRSGKNVQQLYGTAAHTGKNHAFLVHLFAEGRVTLRDTVRMNLWLSGLNVLFFWVVARHVFKHWWAALLALMLLVANPTAIYTAVSELPSASIGLYLLMLFAAVGLLERRQELTNVAVAAAFALMATLTILLGQTRLEVSIFGLTAVAVAWMRMRVGDESLSAFGREVFRRILALIASRWVWVVALASFALNRLSTRDANFFLPALNPLELRFLTLPIQLFDLFFPLAVIACFIFGFLYTARRWLTFFALPVGLTALYETYYGVACNHFELLRYASYLLVPVAGTALFGWRESLHWATRLGLGRYWVRIAALLVLFSYGTVPLRGRYQQAFKEIGFSETTAHFPLAFDMQREVRFLISAQERHPECLFVASVARVGRLEPAGEKVDFKYLVFGGHLSRPVRVLDAVTPEDALATTAPAPCAFLYRSLDCNLARSDGCKDMTAGRTPAEELVFPRNHYNNVEERGVMVPVVRLALYELAPVDERRDATGKTPTTSAP